MNGLERWGRRSMARMEPFGGLRRLQEEVDHLFEDFFGEGSVVLSHEPGAFIPPVDLVEGKDSVVVKMEIPGMKKEDVEIKFLDDMLTISGEKKAEREEKGENRYYLERSYGSFSRAIRMPVKVKPEQVKAAFRDGILEITLPKAEEAGSREIKVAVQ